MKALSRIRMSWAGHFFVPKEIETLKTLMLNHRSTDHRFVPTSIIIIGCLAVFEVVIMIEVATEEMHGSDRVLA
jgi:hypothetical protein